MPGISELGLMKVIDDALSKTDDAAIRTRILRWACAKYASGSAPDPDVGGGPRSKSKRVKKKSKRVTKGKSRKRKATASIDKDLNLQRKGKQAFAKFVEEKKPTSNLERCLLSVYYLLRIVDLDTCTASHVYTCFKDRKWRVPPVLPAALHETASRHGWLDTSNIGNICLTTLGENYVEHDLPKKDRKRK